MKILKHILTYLYYAKYNEITDVIETYKSMFLAKIDINSINILDTSLHKSFPIHYGLIEFFQSVF